MDEAQWLSSTNPQAMLEYLRKGVLRGIAVGTSNDPYFQRKLRLFACACLDLCACGRCPQRDDWTPEQWVVLTDIEGCPCTRAVRAALLRDIFNPFTVIEWRHQKCWSRKRNPRPGERLITVHDSWLTWNDGIIPRLAQAAYDERSGRVCERCDGTGQIVELAKGNYFSNTTRNVYNSGACPDCHGTGRISDGTLDPQRLAILADALIEAGADAEGELVRHLRSPGPHVRGCWAVDILLGKE